jgi:hypothetical protein
MVSTLVQSWEPAFPSNHNFKSNFINTTLLKINFSMEGLGNYCGVLPNWRSSGPEQGKFKNEIFEH